MFERLFKYGRLPDYHSCDLSLPSRTSLQIQQTASHLKEDYQLYPSLPSKDTLIKRQNLDIYPYNIWIYDYIIHINEWIYIIYPFIDMNDVVLLRNE